MIQSLTGVYLTKDIDIVQIGAFVDSGFVSLDPLRYKIKAERLGARAEKEKLLPMIVARANYNHGIGTAYNNNKSVNTDFTTFNLVLKVPLFQKAQYSKIKMANLEVQSLQNDLMQKELELKSQAKQLQISLQILAKQEELYKQSVNDKEGLLKIAKVAFDNERMPIEDYLKYEDDLLMEQSKLLKTEAQKWQTLMKLAVIYGNNIENLIK